jgi:hypothetical protein
MNFDFQFEDSFFSLLRPLPDLSSVSLALYVYIMSLLYVSKRIHGGSKQWLLPI